MASYRYRAAIPARELGAHINNPRADVHIYAKPIKPDVEHAANAKAQGKTVIVDFCDLHFDQSHYREILKYADLVTCSSTWTAKYLKDDFKIDAMVILEPYEFEEIPPHCFGNRLLWFGAVGNYDSLERVKPRLSNFPLTVVCNVVGAIPWSQDNLRTELHKADIVILPETAPYKSANRAVEAIRSGCFVVAEPHPSLEGFPGVYIGNIKKGVEWACQNVNEANQMTLEAQAYIRERLSPKTLGNAWRTAIQKAALNCTLGQGDTLGMVG